MYYLFSFRSRSESMGFFDDIKKAGLSAVLVSTPRSISIGCGLSVKIDTCDLEVCYDLLERCQSNTFLGVFCYDGKDFYRVKGWENAD